MQNPAIPPGFYCLFSSLYSPSIRGPLWAVAFWSVMYRCKYFDIRELVPPQEYRVMGDSAWWLLDVRMLMTLDALRERYGMVIVNTWHSPVLQKHCGYRHQSGFRNRHHYASMADYLKSHSQHKYGRAADCMFVGDGAPTAAQVRKDILDNPDWFPLITAIEDGVSWLHFDVRNCEPVMVFKHG
jgi:hypothetical protein